MSTFKKIISLTLALALCLAAAGCAGNEDAYTSERDLAEKTETGQVKAECEVAAKDFASLEGYTVVYPKGNEQLRQAANKLVKYFADNGVTVTLTADDAAEVQKEILVGDTARAKSQLAANEYAVSANGEKLFFESGNFNGAVKAVSWFISKPFEKGKINTLSGKYEFTPTVERPDGTYTYVWGDEFDGNFLDENKWELTTSISAESSFKLSREEEAMKVEDGLLKLTARRWLDPDNNQIQAIAPYTIEGKEHMNFQYGYVEMRARIPLGAGAWPSLWMSGACSSGAVVSDIFPKGDIKPANFSAEFDIVEYTSLAPNLHKWFYDGVNLTGVKNVEVEKKHSSLGAVEKPVKSDLSLDPKNSYIYQKVGFDWTPTELVIYINDEEYYRYNWKESVQLDGFNDMTDFLNPAFIRINNHLLPKNIPADFSTLPAEFFVDYIRVYQKPETGGIWLAE